MKGFVITVLLLVLFSSVSVIIGIFVVPRGKVWLEKHNFIESEEKDSDSVTIKKGVRTVVTEKNWITDVVESAKKGVVSVAISEATLDPESGSVQSTSNIGTGFIIDDSGLVLTNQHVVSDSRATYVVVTYDGVEHEVIDIARDDVNDLAILKISGTEGLESLSLGDSNALQPGQFVVAIGTPLGDLSGTVTSGIISGLGRSVTASSGGFWSTQRQYENVIQTDAAINPGNSGGPLLDVDGSVIGINFATTAGADNISFALPINQAKERIAQYRQFGKFIKPYLGVEYQLISQAEAMFYNNVVPGAFIKKVVGGSPAAKGGIEKGDIITKIGEDSVRSAFSSLIQKHKVGDTVTFSIWRDGELIEKHVTLEEAPN